VRLSLGDQGCLAERFRYIKELEKIKRDLNPYRESEGYTLYSDWGRRLSIAKDIAAGAAHIHASGIIHRDLTSFNVVLKKENDGLVAKICDFERSKLASNSMCREARLWPTPLLGPLPKSSGTSLIRTRPMYFRLE